MVPLFSQADVLAGSIMVFGYRSFLALSPYANKYFKNNDLLFSMILSVCGVILCLAFDQYSAGAIGIAMGLSIGGFILKSIASENPSTSGINKVAITSGNIGAGAVLFWTHNHLTPSVAFALFLLVVACFIKAPVSQQRPAIKPLTIRNLWDNKLSNLVWFFFGLAIGIRVFGMYTIMPIYSMRKLGYIPDWYGITLMLYGALVILSQLPAVYKKVSFSLNASIIALAVSCLVMGLPGVFCIETFAGAMLWCACLATEEIFAPYIDFHAAKTNHLLVKEISIGLGGAVCLLCAESSSATELISVLSIGCIVIGIFIYNKLSHGCAK